MIRFRQIEAFRCLMVTGTSIGAARKMHITQPAISRLIADLEADLGFSLFNRTKGRLEPTAAGIRFYKAVEENFLGLERLTQEAENIRNEATAALRIACLPVLSTSLLPQILTEFFKIRPDVAVNIDSRNTSEILSCLQDLKADVALSLAFPESPGIHVEPLMEGEVLCAMPASHRLANKDIITLEDLAGENLIGWLPTSLQSYETEQSLFAKAGIQPNFRIHTHTSHTRYAMVANGLGISIVEPFAAKVWLPHGIVVRPFQPKLTYQYVLAYPSNGLRSELVHDLRTASMKVAKNYDFLK
jgi:DNA-binding transcriptional LysR family regulator